MESFDGVCLPGIVGVPDVGVCRFDMGERRGGDCTSLELLEVKEN